MRDRSEATEAAEAVRAIADACREKGVYSVKVTGFNFSGSLYELELTMHPTAFIDKMPPPPVDDDEDPEEDGLPRVDLRKLRGEG